MRHLLTALVVLLCLTGCTRESGKSVIMASQAVEGSELLLTSEKFTKALEESDITPEQRAVIQGHIDSVLKLLGQARDNLVPAISILSDGAPLDTGSTAQDAAKDPDGFVRQAAKQAGKAEVEAEKIAWWRATGRNTFAFAAAAIGSNAPLTLLGGGGLLALIATGLSVAKSLGIKDKVASALAAYAKDAAAADPKDTVALEQIKEKHMRLQSAQGIHEHVMIAVAKSNAKAAKARL